MAWIRRLSIIQIRYKAIECDKLTSKQLSIKKYICAINLKMAWWLDRDLVPFFYIERAGTAHPNKYN